MRTRPGRSWGKVVRIVRGMVPSWPSWTAGVVARMEAGFLLLLFAGIACQASAAVFHVAPQATGTGTGDSWANAMTDIQSAIDAAAEAGGGEVRLAQGVYYPVSSLVLQNGVALLGGFPGLSEEETAADRDVDRFPSVISGDVNRDDIWERFDPADGVEGRFEDRGPIIVDGKLVIPPTESDHDIFAPKGTTLSDNLWRVFNLVDPLDATAVLDGLWIVNGGRGGETTTVKDGERELMFGGAIFVGKNSEPTIRNCRITGCYGYYGTIFYDANRWKEDFPVFKGNKVFFNRVHNRGTFKTSANNLRIEDCDFIGNYKTGGSGSGCIHLWGGVGTVVTNCHFERNHIQWSGQYSPAACISVESATAPAIARCVFTNNYAKGDYGGGPTAGIGCQNARNIHIHDCLFIDNHSFAKQSGDTVVPGVIAAGQGGTFIERTSFIGNVAECRNTDSSKSVTMAPVLCWAIDGKKIFVQLLNCTFHDNESRLWNPVNEELDRLSRAVLCYEKRPVSDGRPVQVGIANCTFSGSTSGSDLVYTGFSTGNPSIAVNSIFWSDAPGYVPFRSDTPGMIIVKDVIAKNLDPVPADIIAEGTRCDDPLLGPLAVSAGGFVPTRKVGARVPGVTAGLDVFAYWSGSFLSGTTCHIAYRQENGEIVNLTPLSGQAIPASPELIGDADGEPRTEGGVTLGAVQALDASVAACHTLTLRTRPTIGGTLTGGHPVQVVGPGEAIVPVTAQEKEGFTFSHWEDGDGVSLGTDPTLTLTGLEADRLLYAVFTAKAVSWTFDLGPGGIFDETGRPTITLTVVPGDSAPAIPPYTVDGDRYLFERWSQEPPLTVGVKDMVFHAEYIEKIFRIVRVAPSVEGGDGSGSSWANAKTNLQEAIDLAATWRGEVWMKKGRYYTAGGLSLRNGVAVRGGFAGVEGERLEDRDPEAYPSVITGDKKGDDVWRDANGWVVEDGVRVSCWNTNGFFVTPAPTVEGKYWEPSNLNENSKVLFDHTRAELDGTAVLDGVALTGAKGGYGGLMDNGPGAGPTLSNCLVCANNASIQVRRGMVFRNCSFVGNAINGVVFATQGDWVHPLEFRDCLFERNKTDQRGPAISCNCPQTVLVIDGCTFRRNYARSRDFGPATVLGLESGVPVITSSRFIDNRGEEAPATIWTRNNGSISDCLFLGNEVISTSLKEITSGIKAHSDLYVDNCSFVSNTAVLTSSAEGVLQAASAMRYTGNRPRLVNCTFLGNRAEASSTAAGAVTAGGTVIAYGQHAYGFLAHCSFLANRSSDGDLVQVQTGATRCQNVFNSILWSDAPDYIPVGSIGEGTIAVLNSTVKGWESLPSWGSESRDVFTADPLYLRPRVIAGRLQIPLQSASPVRKGGLEILLDAQGVPCYLDSISEDGTPSYRRCDQRTIWKPAEPAVQIADGAGAPRKRGRISFGALQCAGGQTLLMLR